MVIKIRSPIRFGLQKTRAALVTELVVAMGILTVAMLPLSLGFLQETKLCRAYYYKALAMEIVDGEMEALVAGEWKAFAAGAQPYLARAEAATNLPPGAFQLTVSPGRLRLEWTPKGRNVGGPVAREVRLKTANPK